MVTDAQIKRLTRDWTADAGEAVKVEQIGSTFYAFGSELATLRIFRKYAETHGINQGYSKNLESFYFSLTPRV